VGPVIYGERIIGIENDYLAYQSIVYNKAALILFMLKDILGEEDFLKRLKNTLEKLKYRSVPSATFIKTFSEGSETAARFLTKWINARKIPEIDLHAVLEGKKAHLEFEQSDGNFIFPIKIEIKTEAGSATKQLIIKEKKTVFDIAEESEIKWINVDDSRTLVRIKLQK
jgi:aminopeptidase N